MTRLIFNRRSVVSLSPGLIFRIAIHADFRRITATMLTPARVKPTPVARHFPWFLAGTVALFAASWCYVLLRLEPSISLHGANPTFFYDPLFRSALVARPGGWTEYVSGFLSRCDAVPALGSAIQAGLALVLVVLTRLVWKAITGRSPGAAAFIPGFLALWLRVTWGYPSYPLAIAIAMALACTLGFNLALRLPVWSRIVLCWISNALLFLFAGPVASILHSILAAMLEGVVRKKWPVGLACFAPVILPFAWALIGPDPAYWKIWLPEERLSQALMFALVLWIPLTVIILLRGLQPQASNTSTPHASRRKAKSTAHHSRPWLEPAMTLIVFTIGAVALWSLFDETRQARTRIDFYSSRGNHEQVIAASRGLPRGELDSSSELRLHRALYHTGRLASDLFTFPSLGERELFPSLAGDLRNCRPQAETLYELGLVNDAEHFAHEALEWEGERPEIFRLLAKINCLKGRPAAARVFLNRLARIPFEEPWTKDWLRSLDATGNLPDSAGLAEIRSRMLTRDVAHDSLLIEPLLIALLASNSTNRMAYDFLMTFYLLHFDLPKLAAQLPQLEKFGCREIPVHLEQALLIYQALAGTEVKLPNLQVRDSSRKRFQEFSRVMDQETQRKRNPLPALAAGFGDTYWFYYASRPSNGPEASP